MPRARLSDGRVVESTDNLLGRFGGSPSRARPGTRLSGRVVAGRLRARRAAWGVTVSVLGSPSEAQRDS